MNEDEIRKHFESWAQAHPRNMSTERYTKDGFSEWAGHYQQLQTDVSWIAWKAAWEQSKSQQQIESKNVEN